MAGAFGHRFRAWGRWGYGAAAEEDREDRVPFREHSSGYSAQYRGLQARAAGAWPCRRENFRLGASLRRGQSRTVSGDRAGTGGPQDGRNRGGHRCGDCGGQTRNADDPDCDGVKRRSGRDRVSGEPRAPRRKCHRAQRYLTRAQWEAAGAAEGSRDRASRVAFLWNPDVRGNVLDYKETEGAASSLRLQLQSVEVVRAEDLDRAFSAVTKERAQALIVPPQNTVGFANRGQIATFAQKNRLPSMYGQREYVDAGGLMAYGPSTPDMHRRAATYVDKILKGTKPADLPVEQPRKFELIINLKTAKQIGLTIPPNVLVRADTVIK
jgi:ABC transporter substrate binding protein